MSTGIKHDQGKPSISLIPVEAIIEEARAFDFGAKKYGRHNFRLGMDHTRVLDAALRHILAIVRGEDVDPESGLKHWAHARACLGMYAYFQSNGVGKDDRYKEFLQEANNALAVAKFVSEFASTTGPQTETKIFQDDSISIPLEHIGGGEWKLTTRKGNENE